MTEYRDASLESDSNINSTTDRSGADPAGTDVSAPTATSESTNSSKGASIDAPLSQRRQK